MIIFLLLLLTFTSCSSSCPERRERYEHAVRARGKYVRSATQDGLIPFGSGHGVSGDVENLYLSFDKIGHYSLTEARIFMIYQGEKFLRFVNEDRELRPHLREFPATNKLIELHIGFKNLDGTKVSPEFISSVMLLSGKLIYDIEDGSFLGKIIHRETYEEALEWVKENAPEVLLDGSSAW